MKIRIHKDIAVRWTVKTSGEDTPLEGRDISVILTDPLEGRTMMPFAVVDDNVIVLTWYGKDQKHLGKYIITVAENAGKEGSTVLDAVDFVTLVARTDEEDVTPTAEGLDAETVELSGDLQQNGRGLSAYEVALVEGFVGTEAEWLESLKAPNLMSQYSTDKESWHDVPTENDRYMRTSADNGATWSAAIKIQGTGGGGASTYADLPDKPSINSTTLSGNKTAAQLGLQPTVSDIDTIRSNAASGKAASDALGGHTVGKDVPSDAKFTDTIYDDTAIKGRVSTIEGKEAVWDAKQDAIDDLATIRSNAATGVAIAPKVPAQASATNQLADKDFVNSSIQNVAAYYITKDAAGNPFATKAELLAATTFYSGGQVRVPTRNDYLVVLADESKTIAETGENPTTRYIYDNNVWSYQYIVNRSGLTAAQWAAVSSGITAALVSKLGALPDAEDLTALFAGKVDKVSGKGLSTNDYTDAEKTKVANAEQTTNKVTSLSASSTNTQYPGAKCVYDAINPAVQSSPASVTPNVLAELGTLTGTVSIVLAAGVSGRCNHYFMTFSTGATAPTITWDAAITSWYGGSAPTINANKHYEVSVLNGVAVAVEV